MKSKVIDKRFSWKILDNDVIDLRGRNKEDSRFDKPEKT